MSKIVVRRLALLAVALLVGCPSAPYVNRSGFPAEISGVGDTQNFPLRAAQYQRGKMFMYQPGMKNYSIGRADQPQAAGRSLSTLGFLNSFVLF